MTALSMWPAAADRDRPPAEVSFDAVTAAIVALVNLSVGDRIGGMWWRERRDARHASDSLRVGRS